MYTKALIVKIKRNKYVEIFEGEIDEIDELLI